MKIRAGFVSNSSSSSFVIAISNEFDKVVDEVSKIHSGIGKMIKTATDSLFGQKISTVDEYKEYFTDMYLWDDDLTIEGLEEEEPYLFERYNKVLEKIESGHSVYIFSLDYDEEATHNIINALADNEMFIVLEGE